MSGPSGVFRQNTRSTRSCLTQECRSSSISSTRTEPCMNTHSRQVFLPRPSSIPAEWEEPIGLLTKVNRLFCQSTGGEQFATLFFGVYDDGTRQLDYVNCGHNAPSLRRDDGTVQVLDSTATVLGSFKDRSCEVRSIHLQPGDTLIMFSDGAVDAVSPTGKEFGEQRLMAVWQEHLHLDIERLVEALCTSVQSSAVQA
jgi:serine phosphatase RsbU (regulator of sigma subunit)